MKSLLGGFCIIVRPSLGKGKVTIKQSNTSAKASSANREQHQDKLITNANQLQATMLNPLLSVYCYIIQASTGQYYTGITKQIQLRLQQHNTGVNKSTQKLKGWYIVHLQVLPTREKARELEVKIKARGANRYMYSYNKAQRIKASKSKSGK
jgi:putative endonuclease